MKVNKETAHQKTIHQQTLFSLKMLLFSVAFKYELILSELIFISQLNRATQIFNFNHIQSC